MTAEYRKDDASLRRPLNRRRQRVAFLELMAVLRKPRLRRVRVLRTIACHFRTRTRNTGDDMDTTSHVERVLFSIAASFLALIASVPLPVSARSSPNSVTIAVFADHYVVGRKRFDNLSSLQTHVNATRAGKVHVHACGSAVTRPWMAVVHRFRHL